MSSYTTLTLDGFERDMDGRRIFVQSLQAVDKGGTANIILGELEQTETNHPLKVALKVFPALLTDVTHELLRRELNICRKLDHPLILPFLGTCESESRTILVSRYMENGNLCRYLENNPGADRNHLVFQVSHAVLYLHETVRVAHGDLKCENVLVSRAGDAYLADFGLSTTRDKSESEDTTTVSIRGKGTIRFCAPEVFLDSQTHGRSRSKTTQSDVYAFGMLILQAYTGKVPWYGMEDFAVMAQVVVHRKFPSRPSVFNDLLWTVCEACWRFEPDSRPHMRNLATLLRQNMEASRGGRAVPSTSDILQSLYKVDTERELPHLPLSEPISITSVLSRILEHPESMNAIAYMPDGASIVSGCLDGMIRVWDIESGGMIGKPMEGHTGVVVSVAISADATRIASGSEDGTIRVWNMETRATVALLGGHAGSVYSVAFSPDGSRVVSGSSDKTIRVWDLATATTVVGPIRLEEHSNAICSAAYSPDGARLVSGSGDTVCVWNAETGFNVWQVEISSGVGSVAFSPNGKQIVAGCDDGSVHVLDANRGKIALAFQGCTDLVNSVAFSPNGKIIASGADDSTVRLWNAETGDGLIVFSGHRRSVYSVAFSPDGRHIASASEDKTVRIWNITTTVE